MAREWEIKLTGNIASALTDAMLPTAWQQMPMRTVYYDTPERSLSAAHRMLRLRREGNASVLCLKAPHPEARTRQEWQVDAEVLDDAALRRLVSAGAPADLPQAARLAPVCGAEFTRRFALLHFPDGSCAELAHDVGILKGATRQQPFEELEIELKSGSPKILCILAQRLCVQYGLREETRSKFARAKALCVP